MSKTMHKLLLTTALLLPTLALAQPDPCKSLDGMLDQVEAAYKENVPLNKVLEVVPDHYKGVTRDIYNWMPKGDIRYTAFRVGLTAGCSALNQGVYYHGKK